jgi:hypothetical protein
MSDSFDMTDPRNRPNSLGAINLMFDGPADTTVRPATDILLKVGQEARERIERYEREARQRELENPSTNGTQNQDNGSCREGFCSPNAINLVIDGPGDTTVRPATGLALKLGLEAKERLERYLREAKQREQGDSPKSES